MFLPTIQTIRKKTAKDKALEIDILIAHAINKNRAYVLANPNQVIGFWPMIKLHRYLHKLNRNYPIAYILRQKEFYNLSFNINKHTLIPRPDSEIIIDETIKYLQLINNEKNIIIDIGTGSGCLAIAIAKNIPTPQTKVFATDQSKSALNLAKINAKKHQLDLNFYHSNLLESIPKNILSQPDINYVIIANLPYLTFNWYKKELSIHKEPKTALVADNNNGLSLYEKLFKQIKTFIPHYNNLFIIIEIDPRQTKPVKSLTKKYFSTFNHKIKKDLSGHNRIVIIQSN